MRGRDRDRPSLPTTTSTNKDLLHRGNILHSSCHRFPASWGPPKHPLDLLCWSCWGSWPQYPSEPIRSAQEPSPISLSQAPSDRCLKLIMKDEPLSPAPAVLPEQERFHSSSSRDAAVASASPPSTDDYCQFQDLLRREAGELCTFPWKRSRTLGISCWVYFTHQRQVESPSQSTMPFSSQPERFGIRWPHVHRPPGGLKNNTT